MIWFFIFHFGSEQCHWVREGKETQEENTNTPKPTDLQHFISPDRKRDCTLRWTESGGRSNSLERKAARRSASRWNLSRSHQRPQWPVMCGFNCNKTVEFAGGPHVKRGQSAHEIWRPVSAATKLDALPALVHLQKPFTRTPQIPAATSFSLTAHHLLTHRLTSLTLTLARAWLRPWNADWGEMAPCTRWRSLSKIKQEPSGLIRVCKFGVTADDFTLPGLRFQFMGLKLLWQCIVQHCDNVLCVR